MATGANERLLLIGSQELPVANRVGHAARE